jgi:hypothetical protein
MTTQWRLLVDWDRDGNFSGLYDNITNDLMQLEWFLGMRQAYSTTADDLFLKATLRNIGRKFSPEYASSPLAGKLLPNVPLRLEADDGVVTRTLWTGRIETITPLPNQYGPRTVEIVAAGPLKLMKATETNQSLKEQARTDEILRPLILEATIPPAKPNAWILGVSRLGVNTVLARESDIMELEEGVVTLTLAGDNWVKENADGSTQNFSVYRAIQDVVAAEQGRFFFNRAGKAVFWNRDHLSIARPIAATFSDSMQDMSYTFGDPQDFHNEVMVTCHPRSLSPTNNEVLWQLTEPLSLEVGRTQTLRAKYEDVSGGRVGGRNTSLSYSFSSGSGTVSLEARANQATLTVINTGSVPAVLASCIITGQKLVDQGRMEAIARDTTSISLYGRRSLRLHLAALSSLEEAQRIAEAELARRVTPRGVVQSLTLRSHATQGTGHQPQQLALTIGDVISLDETQTAHSAEYAIIGEAHRLSEGGTLYETIWYLEPLHEVWLAHYPARYADSAITLKSQPEPTRLAQSFELAQVGSVGQIALWLRKVGQPSGQLTVKLYSDHPKGGGWYLGRVGASELGTTTRLASETEYPASLLATSSQVDLSSLSAAYAWIAFNFPTPPTLAANTRYWLVVENNASPSTTDYLEWATDGSDPTYALGWLIAERGVSWKHTQQGAAFRVIAA